MFDVLITENNTEYGIINGNSHLLYIKVGNGGDIYGKENKYLRIAKQIRAEHGCSVLVSSNPIDLSIKDCMVLDSAFIDKYFKSTHELYAFGNSKGGQMLASYAYLNSKIKRVLSVNAPLMINLHKTKEGLAKFEGERLTMLYGGRDQSMRYLPFLNALLSEGNSTTVIQNADHNFENMLEEFIDLPERYLF
ncbi:MAG: hypothetical protein IJX08_02290 [Clostridia bacterium]|nr:hypothetical protein [Clostridia bacterium]